MAIIENRVTEEGDVLIIKPEVPIVGILALYQFVDTTVNESETDFFKKEFRYSIDGGLTFSQWEQLTLININSVSISRFDAFVLEYKYTRIGNTPEVELEFKDILVSGEITQLPYPIYDTTIFKKFFNVNDINVFGWAINVLEKLYTKGLILPDYVERAENKSNLEDEDFIVYWNSITHIYAIIVYFARQFHNFETNQLLLEQFLNSKDLTLPNDRNISDLLYLYSSYVEEYKKRGTYRIVQENEDIDGELLRLVSYRNFEEFIFCLFQNFETGWCVGKSSPCWYGSENIPSLIRGYENQFGRVVDLEKYPLSQDLNISLEDDRLKISNYSSSSICGINDDSDPLKRIKVNPLQSYEISFRIKYSIQNNSVVFGCLAWDSDGNPVSLKHSYSNIDKNYFLEDVQLKLVDTDYWVRGVVYSLIPSLRDLHILNIGVGNNLRLTEQVSSIMPIIGIRNTSSSNIIFIDRIIVRPVKVNFSRGQLGVKNIVYLKCKNNSDLYDIDLKNQISNKLLPYHNVLKTNFL